MNKKTLPPPPDFDSPEEARDIIHFLWNKLAELEDRLNPNSRKSSVPSSQQALHSKAKNRQDEKSFSARWIWSLHVSSLSLSTRKPVDLDD
ncbi:hypothetical protein BOW42_12705, partial [Solemya velum gill symbiont]